jgi:hypothetical protein
MEYNSHAMEFNAETITAAEIAELLKAGDEELPGSLRVNRKGKVFLSQDEVGSAGLDDIAFYFETFSAGLGFMGPEAETGDLEERLMVSIRENWALYQKFNHPAHYIDVF